MVFSQKIMEKKSTGKIPVIPDFKRISPKEGELFGANDPVYIAQLLEKLGAPALSVVTESKEFGGSMGLLSDILSAVSIPVLRKDFIHSTKDIEATANAGASAILLICSCLSEIELTEYYHASLECGLEPLVEIHSQEELNLAQKLKVSLLGINNRDITNLEKDSGSISLSKKLLVHAPKETVRISESGISSPRQARAVIAAGADAVLIGTAIWRASDIAASYLTFCEGE